LSAPEPPAACPARGIKGYVDFCSETAAVESAAGDDLDDVAADDDCGACRGGEVHRTSLFDVAPARSSLESEVWSAWTRS
jgi:hypothetical protein